MKAIDIFIYHFLIFDMNNKLLINYKSNNKYRDLIFINIMRTYFVIIYKVLNIFTSQYNLFILKLKFFFIIFL